MPRQKGPSNNFSPEDIAKLEAIVDRYAYRSIRWERHFRDFNHPLGSLKVMASRLREKLRRKRGHENEKMRLKAIRAICAGGELLRDDHDAAPVAKHIGLEEHRHATSTQALQFAAEMLHRVGEQGVTAGLLGDPPPGRSALDRKRAGIEDSETVDRRKESEWGVALARLRLRINRGDLPKMGTKNPSSPRLRRTAAASPKPKCIARKTDCPEVASE